MSYFLIKKQKEFVYLFLIIYFLTIYVNKQKIVAQTCVYKQRPIQATKKVFQNFSYNKFLLKVYHKGRPPVFVPTKICFETYVL